MIELNLSIFYQTLMISLALSAVIGMFKTVMVVSKLLDRTERTEKDIKELDTKADIHEVKIAVLETKIKE